MNLGPFRIHQDRLNFLAFFLRGVAAHLFGRSNRSNLPCYLYLWWQSLARRHRLLIHCRILLLVVGNLWTSFHLESSRFRLLHYPSSKKQSRHLPRQLRRLPISFYKKGFFVLLQRKRLGGKFRFEGSLSLFCQPRYMYRILGNNRHLAPRFFHNWDRLLSFSPHFCLSVSKTIGICSTELQ